jgi:methylenetetrahydrofolate reductase (NADPH)
MRISELYGRRRPVYSFEFFPPRTDDGFAVLYQTVAELKRLDPDFVSVTWGAGGSTRRKTVEIVIRIQQEIGVATMAHLSCIGSTPEQLGETLDRLATAGIENVLALGGDRPPDYRPPPGAFTYANELAGFIHSRWDFCLGGACYPETHPTAPSPEVDLAIEVPIVPGIMPIISAASIRHITSLCGARIPAELKRALSDVEHDDALTMQVGVEWATLQCRELLARGVPGIHFYTLNKSPATRSIFQSLLEA